MKVDLSCPLELWEYRLPTKESAECVLMLFNLENRIISSMQISLTALNAAGEPISNHTERPMALAAEGKQGFELRFAMEEGEEMDSLSLLFEKVWFEDGAVWRRASSAQLTEYAPNDLETGRELENLRYVAGPDAVGYPEDQGRVWLCVCGRVNAEDEDTCRRCGRDRGYIFTHDSRDAVKDSISTREKELEKKGQKALEESSRQELLKQSALRSRGSSHKRRWVGAAIASVLIVALYFSMALLMPEVTYARAVAALNAGSAATAKELFESLLDYRDALGQVKECDYVIAMQCLEKSDMDSAVQAQGMFEKLESYKDSPTRVKQSFYKQAELLMQYNEFERAANIFLSLGAYTDASARFNEASYRLAKRMMNAQQYDAAAEKFIQLGDYEDSTELARQSVYRAATSAMTQSRFDDAAGLYASIADYEDSEARSQDALYAAANALMTAKDYDGARVRYAQLGEFRESLGKWKEATYAAASDQRDLANYAGALLLFMEIKDYSDAPEQILACSYEPAKAFMASGEYEKAAQLLAAMPDYKDSTELLNQCSYLPAMDAFNSKEWTKAIALFDKIPSYKDAKAKANQARYTLADEAYLAKDLPGAADMFEKLGSYEDSKTRAQSIRYAIANNQFDSGDYDLAEAGFIALGDYSDSATRAKECAYEVAVGVMDSGDLQGAYELFSAIQGLPKAKDAASSCLYQMAVNARGTGDLSRAAEMFLKAGTYQDARKQHDQAVYDEALHWMEAKDYQHAGELFYSIAAYQDANVKSAECYDLWLADRLAEARTLQKAGQLQEVIELLQSLPMTGLPNSYAELRTIYERANLDIASQLVSEGRQLEAWEYLGAAGDSAEARKLRERRIYQLLGEWETSGGARYAFNTDGSAMLADEDGFYFNVVNYGVLTGSEPDDLSLSFTIVNNTADTLSLKDAKGKTFRLNRVADAQAASVQAVDVVSDTLE